MWKISRNLIFHRWSASKPNPVETKNKKTVYPQVLVTAFPSEKTKNYEQNHKEKENFHKQSKRFWNCDQFQNIFSRSIIFETAGWLGTVTVLCFNYHYKHFNSIYKNERKKFHCLFSRNVLAMPENSLSQENLQPKVVLPEKPSLSIREELKSAEAISEQDFLEELEIKSSLYLAALHNSVGVSCCDSDTRKAFRHFQSAARLGSSQGLYNLGLCYELGKGTKVNLTRAAFCYRKAAMKGHGLASFNLAVFFSKGLGGLPVDHETAKLLLAEAADKDIPEAQIYLGLECLEIERWSEAYEIFDQLAKRNNLDGKYYLGLCYANGWGVNQDETAAAEIFSQTAALGHPKSILKLSKCYEEGFGSYQPDLDFAQALCQILVDQGDEEGKEALLRIKVKKENLIIKDLLELKLSSLKRKNANIHTSASVPELTSKKSSKTKYPASFTSSYLDIVTPFPSMKTDSLREGTKPAFYIGDDKLKMNLSSIYMPHYQSNIVPAMAAKT